MNYRYPLWVAPTVPAATVAKPSTMGKVFVAIFLMVVFEGSLRKWVSSDLTVPLVLLRDGLAIYGIYWAMSRGKLVDTQAGTQALWLWTAAVVLWGLLQLMVNQSSLVVYVVGLRFWLLYLWFAYAAAVSITEFDFSYITKTMLKVMLLIVPLVILQFYQPPGAFINQQVDGDEDRVFRLTADIVRTTGTFSFTTGHTTFLAVVSPFVLAALTSGTQFFKKKWMPVLIFIGLTIATMLSGSRAALIMFGLLFFIYILISLLYAKGTNKGNQLFLLFGAVLILLIVPYIFSNAVDATRERVTLAGDSEVLSERIMSIFFGEPEIYDRLTFFGLGLGAGSNFVGGLSETEFTLGETEAARTILEGGLLGFAFIGIKLLVIFIGLRKSILIAQSTGNSLPLLLWFTLALALFTWSIIGQLTVNALGYMLLGLGVASLRLTSNKS